MGSHSQTRDVFAEAKARYMVMDVWRMLGLPGDPKIGNNFSPFRDEKDASCSIYEDGRKFKDQGDGGEQGDIIAFIHAVTDWTHAEIREWLMERLGIDHHEGNARVPIKVFTPAPEPATSPKVIEWPCELVTGTEETWERFADLRGLSYAGVWTMVEAGVLRFGIVDGHKCFIVTDHARRAAEIRRLDGKNFGSRKAYPLKGVDKSWPVGAELIARTESWTFAEGATDFLHEFDLYVQYRKSGGQWVFTPMGLLGAGIKHLAPEFMEKARGRAAVFCPDGDDAGDKMGEHWSEQFAKAGADVEVIEMPPGKDLRDMCLAGEIQPKDLFE